MKAISVFHCFSIILDPQNPQEFDYGDNYENVEQISTPNYNGNVRTLVKLIRVYFFANDH